MGNPAGTEKRVKSREANCWQSFFIRRGQHVKDFSRTTAEISQLSSQLLFSIFFSIFWLINIKNSQLHFHGNWQRQKRNGKQKYFFSGSQLRAGSVELEKLQQLVVPGGQPTIEPKRARTHTNTNTARIRIPLLQPGDVSQPRKMWLKYFGYVFFRLFWYEILLKGIFWADWKNACCKRWHRFVI